MAIYIPELNAMLMDGRIYEMPDPIKIHNAKKVRYNDHQVLLQKPQRYIGYVPVICKRLFKKGKTQYAELEDFKGTFTVISNGYRRIDNVWVHFLEDFEKGSCYLLKMERNNEYFNDLKLLGKKKLN